MGRTGKKSRDTTGEDGRVTRSGDTDKLLTEREGFTEVQIVDTIRQWITDLTDPVSLQDQNFDKQTDERLKDKTEGSTRLEHLKIETRLIDEMFERLMENSTDTSDLTHDMSTSSLFLTVFNGRLNLLLDVRSFL